MWPGSSPSSSGGWTTRSRAPSTASPPSSWRPRRSRGRTRSAGSCGTSPVSRTATSPSSSTAPTSCGRPGRGRRASGSSPTRPTAATATPPTTSLTVRPASVDALRDYYRAVRERTSAYLATVTPDDLDRIVDRRWDPPVTLGVRLVSIADDEIQHAGQAAYAAGCSTGGDRRGPRGGRPRRPARPRRDAGRRRHDRVRRTAPSRSPSTTWRASRRRSGPRWVWWSAPSVAAVLAAVPVARAWDLAAVHRLVHGGWRADPAVVWARSHGLDPDTIPRGAPARPVRPRAGRRGPRRARRPTDGHLRPEWPGGEWAATPERRARWAALALDVAARQRDAVDALAAIRPQALATARAESAAEVLCVELGRDGLPLDVGVAEAIIAGIVGPRPRSPAEAEAQRDERDAHGAAARPAGSHRSAQPGAGAVAAAPRRCGGERHAGVAPRGAPRRPSARRRAADVAARRAHGDDVRLRLARRARARTAACVVRGRAPTGRRDG